MADGFGRASSYVSIKEEGERADKPPQKIQRTIFRYTIVATTVLVGLCFSAMNFVDLSVDNYRGKLAGKAGLKARKPPGQQLVEFRVPQKAIPGSTIHILLPGTHELHEVQIPKKASAGEMLQVEIPEIESVRIDKKNKDADNTLGDTGKEKGQGAASTQESSQHPAGDDGDLLASENVLQEVEMTWRHFFLLIIVIVGGSTLILLAIQGVFFGFGMIEVAPDRAMDHPGRFTDHAIDALARQALQDFQDGIPSLPGPPLASASPPASEPPASPGAPTETKPARSPGSGSSRPKDNTGKRSGDSPVAAAAQPESPREYGSSMVRQAGREGGVTVPSKSEAQKAGEALGQAAADMKRSAGASHPAPPATLDDADASSAEIWEEVQTRGLWLLGLLLVQSFMAAILKSFEQLIREHAVVAVFMMMIVGAAGNTGAQSVARVVQELARRGQGAARGWQSAVRRQAPVAALLGGLLFVGAFLRVYVGDTSGHGVLHALGIGVSVGLLVALAELAGVVLTYALFHLGLDPAHGAAVIQVGMDCVGVVVTGAVCSLVLWTH